jgi:hypothetical protein
MENLCTDTTNFSVWVLGVEFVIPTIKIYSLRHFLGYSHRCMVGGGSRAPIPLYPIFEYIKSSVVQQFRTASCSSVSQSSASLARTS